MKSKEIDWSQKFPYEDTVAKDSTLRYIAIGWGDKGFYLDTPTWADLKFSTAFKAAFWLGNSAIHTTFYKEMKLGEDCKKLKMLKENISRSKPKRFTVKMIPFMKQKAVIVSYLLAILGRMKL